MAKDIYCTKCQKVVTATIATGLDIYPHRPDLYTKLFYVCPQCHNYVGTHSNGKPLGTIPYPELRQWRNKVHNVIDKYWLPNKTHKRVQLYKELSDFIGKEYHTGELNTIDDCKNIIDYYNNNFNHEDN